MGRVSGVFGTRGWLKIYSYTRPRENIFNYPHWQLAQNGSWHAFEVQAHRRQGSSLVASLDEIADRDTAVGLIDCDIAVKRSDFPHSAPGEYYWSDLVGLDVINAADINLGKVTKLLDTGANDILVVKGDRERLIPFVLEHFILDVAVDQGRIRVDWHEDD